MKRDNKFKRFFHKHTKGLSKTGEELSVKADEIGREGVNFAKEKLSVLGDTAADITNIIKYKMEMNNKQNELNLNYHLLGEISLILFKSKTKEKYNESFRKTIDQISDIKQFIDEKSAVYKDLRKRYSSNYEIKKLTDDLGHGDVVISQSIISENSNMADKLLKDTLLPKEALISVVKRGEEVIIPDGNTKLYPGDNVTVIGRPEDVEKIARRISSRE
jgi:K+/H+ antiporter YhaU regulatory subunit KhtT